MKIDDIVGGKMKHGSTIYEMDEAKYSGIVVWPLNVVYTYQIVQNSITFHYTDGFYMLRADGNNAVYFTGTVQKMNGSTVVETLTGVTLDPSLQPNSEYYLGGSYTVWGYNLGTTERGQYNEQITLSYQGATANVTVYQQANVKTAYGSPSDTTIVDYDHPGTPSITYSVSLSANKYRKTTSSDVCPASGTASGDYVQLYCSAEHTTTTPYPYTIYRTQNYKYTATGDTLYPETTVYDSGTTNVTSTTTDDVSGSITGSATGFTRNGLRVTIANRLKVIGAERSVTYTATNGNASSSVTLYQQANAYIGTTSSPSVSCSFHDYSQGDLLPANGGSIRIDYVSQITETETYTSGSYTETNPLTSSVQDLLNCSTLTSSVSGSGYFNISVGRNTGGSRYVSLTLRYDTTYYQTIGLWQDANAEAISATLNPYVYESGNNKGRVSLRLTIDSADRSKVTWPVTVNDIVVNNNITGTGTTTYSYDTVSFPTPETGKDYSEYVLPRVLLLDGATGTAQVVKDSTKPTSDQITNFTCEQISYSIM